jgi:hypothetical protein
MYAGLSRRFGKRVGGPTDVERAIRWSLRRRVRQLRSFIITGADRVGQRVHVLLAQSYLAAAWSPEGVNPSYFQRAVALVRRVDATIDPALTWDQARAITIRLSDTRD